MYKTFSLLAAQAPQLRSKKITIVDVLENTNVEAVFMRRSSFLKLLFSPWSSTEIHQLLGAGFLFEEPALT
jgi:hypothetical protein